MRVLVTGAAGHLGSALTRALERHGFEVVAFDRRPARSPEAATWVQADVRSADQLRAATAGCEVVFHLAAVLPQHHCRAAEMHAINVGGTRNVVTAALAAGVRRLVFLSSVEVYGIPEQCPCDEDALLRPVGLYGQQKVEAELVAFRAAAAGALEVVVLRPCTIVGRGASPHLYRPFVRLFRSLQRGWPLPLIGGGRHRVAFIDVEDVVEACLRAARHAGRTACFNLAAPVPPLAELFTQVADRLGLRCRFWNVPAVPVKAILALGDLVGWVPIEPEHRSLLSRDYTFTTARVEAELGFRPRPAVDAFVAMAHDWQRAGLL